MNDLKARELLAIADALYDEAENLSPSDGNCRGQVHPAPFLREQAAAIRALTKALQPTSERERIVAWLRERDRKNPPVHTSWIADRIERGDHWESGDVG